MSMVDLSYNLLDMEAVDFFWNVPVHVTELNLSNNTLRGTFPDPFPFLGNLTQSTRILHTEGSVYNVLGCIAHGEETKVGYFEKCRAISKA